MLTITTAASDRSLLTIAELRAAAGATDASHDTELQTVGDRVSATIARLCLVRDVPPTPPTMREETLTQVFRHYWGAEELTLARRPVTSITSVVVDDLTLETTDYELDVASGLLYRLNDDYRTAWTGSKATVVFTCGWSVVPHDLKLAASKMVTDIYTTASRDPNLKRHRIEGVGEREYWVSPSSDPLVSQEVMELLMPYVNWRL